MNETKSEDIPKKNLLQRAKEQRLLRQQQNDLNTAKGKLEGLQTRYNKVLECFCQNTDWNPTENM